MEDLMKFVDKSGRKRLGPIVTCGNCQVLFVTRRDQPAKYCSRECSSEAHRKRATVVCAWCGEEISRPLSRLSRSKSGLHFCNRICKEQAQQIGGIKEISPRPYYDNTGRTTYRENYKLKYGLRCRRCGYDEFECGIEVHHIDGNRDHNDDNNLISLCACCHRSLHQGLWLIENFE